MRYSKYVPSAISCIRMGRLIIAIETSGIRYRWKCTRACCGSNLYREISCCNRGQPRDYPASLPKPRLFQIRKQRRTTLVTATRDVNCSKIYDKCLRQSITETAGHTMSPVLSASYQAHFFAYSACHGVQCLDACSTLGIATWQKFGDQSDESLLST